MLVLIWVQAIYKGYQQTKKVTASYCYCLLKKICQDHYQSFKSLVPDQDQGYNVGPDLGPNYLQILSADKKSGC